MGISKTKETGTEQMKFRSAFAVLSMTVALAACGNLPFQQEERSGEEAAPSGHVGPPGVSPLEQPIETGAAARPIATAEASTMNTAMFRAAGSGWAATAGDKAAVYERPGAKSVGVGVKRMTYGGGVEFIGSMNGSVFALNIRAEACEAGGQKAPFTANLRVGGQRLSGCAVPTDSMPKAQVTASSAAPKPKAQAKPKAPEATAPGAKPATPAAGTAEPAKPETPATTTPATPPATTTAPETPATGTAETPAPATPAPAVQPPEPAPVPVTTPVPAAPASEPAAPAPAGGDGGNGAAPAVILPVPGEKTE